ncbi:MAG TPA: pseudouridine-5-phosphate glycosidase [Blastocatellia bacterium]|nr:pseudouridine-5-phosphate glycosidase [Blastocatellia bacterium]
MDNTEFLQTNRDVAAALSDHRPVVALESTVIAHGLPRPQNIETAERLEQIVRAEGATPATIAVLDGMLCVGLDRPQLDQIATRQDIKKLSVRDLAIGVAHKWNGATTVASTMWIAHRAGIKVFATGGVGGVHRGSLPDVSADLPQLAQIPMIVVCSGAKIVLDLPATREWLETNSITVVGYQCDEMPAFYSQTSGLPIDVRCDTPEEVAHLFATQRHLDVRSALLVTVPVPSDAEVEQSFLNKVLEDSLAQAERDQISGRNVTPFLLAQMSQRSDGATLRANIALLENNARVAAQIAATLSSVSEARP